MARAKAVDEVPSEQEREVSEQEREGMRAHDENGSVRPADGRWELHKPEDESKECSR